MFFRIENRYFQPPVNVMQIDLEMSKNRGEECINCTTRTVLKNYGKIMLLQLHQGPNKVIKPRRSNLEEAVF